MKGAAVAGVVVVVVTIELHATTHKCLNGQGSAKRVGPRLRELAPPAAGGSQEAGITQPRVNLLANPCKYIRFLLSTDS